MYNNETKNEILSIMLENKDFRRLYEYAKQARDREMLKEINNRVERYAKLRA